jgi:hypothetical protein
MHAMQARKQINCDPFFRRPAGHNKRLPISNLFANQKQSTNSWNADTAAANLLHARCASKTSHCKIVCIENLQSVLLKLEQKSSSG